MRRSGFDTTRRAAFCAALLLLVAACDSGSDPDGAADVGSDAAAEDIRGDPTDGQDRSDTPPPEDDAGPDGGPAGDAGDVGAGAGDGGEGGTTACVTAEVLAVLEEHVADLELAASRLAGHASDREATGFLLAPGLDPGIVAQFAGPLIAACEGPSFYVETCDGTFCGQIECTGRGTGWAYHSWRDATPVVQENGWRFEEARVVTTWEEGADEITFTLQSTATSAGGADWSVTGSGRMGPAAVEATAELPSLFPAGPATLTLSVTPAAHEGTLSVAGAPLATLEEDGTFTTTAPCP